MNYSMLFPEKQSQPATCRLAALAREQKLRFQQGNCRFSVAKFTIKRHLHQFLQRMPLHVQKFAGIEVRRAAVQVAPRYCIRPAVRPVSSESSRAAASSGASPGSSLPAGTSSSVRENG